jgi:hypothetical protein
LSGAEITEGVSGLGIGISHLYIGFFGTIPLDANLDDGKLEYMD